MSISYIHCQFLGPRVIPAKAGIQETSAWGLDARLRGHDVLLVPDLRNGHLEQLIIRAGKKSLATGDYADGWPWCQLTTSYRWPLRDDQDQTTACRRQQISISYNQAPSWRDCGCHPPSV